MNKNILVLGGAGLTILAVVAVVASRSPERSASRPEPAPAQTAADTPVEPENTKPPAEVILPTARATPPQPAPEPALEEGNEVGQRTPSYKNTVRRPADMAKAEEFDTQAVTKPTVYIVNSTTCPYSTAYIDRMKEIEKTYMAKGVDVVHVYPVHEQTAEDKTAHHTKNAFQGGIIDDTKADFARALDVTKTPTVILTNAKGQIVYRGRIDDNQKPDRVKAHELADAIDATLAGKPVMVSTTEPFG